MNKYEERGSPWRMPMEGLKDTDGSPLIKIWKLTKDTHWIISDTNLSGNPIFRNIHSK